MESEITGILEHDLHGRRFKVFAEIDLGALKRNYIKIAQTVRARKPDAGIIPVIKADAYGHGAVRVMLALIECGARCFAVSSIPEALELRGALADNRIAEKVDILILGFSQDTDADLLAKYDLIQTVFSLDYAKKLNDSAAALGVDIRIHIKLDTGMNRLGFSAKHVDESVGEIKEALALGHLKAEGIFSHYACADEAESGLTEIQNARFSEMLSKLAAEGIAFKTRHICNSAAAIRDMGDIYDAVRPGIILYGLMPSDEFSGLKLESVMRLKSCIAHIHELEAGDTVSYGAEFTAPEKMRIATIPIGYADGFIRAYKSASLKVRGNRVPIIGRICMDQCMIDITDTDADYGDEVTIFDSPEEVEALARCAGTIGYEVLCLVGKRVPRVCVES